MTYKGIVQGNVIQLAGEVDLPDGLEVEIFFNAPEESAAPPKGSPRAILEAMDAPPHCSNADVDALLQAIEDGKRPVRFAGPFDGKPQDR